MCEEILGLGCGVQGSGWLAGDRDLSGMTQSLNSPGWVYFPSGFVTGTSHADRHSIELKTGIFRPEGDGRSGPRGPLLPERNLTF